MGNDIQIANSIDRTLCTGEEKEPFEIDFFIRQFERIKAFFEGKIVPPYEVEVQPSATCNAKCYFCWGKELRLEDLLKESSNMGTIIQKILEASAEGYHVEFVKFVGSTGDPLVNPKTLDAIDTLRENKVGARVFTNGIGLTYVVDGQTYAERLIHLAYLRVSLDAGCDETLHKVKKVKKFEKIMQGIEVLRSKSEQKSTGLKIHVGFVISDRNYQDILLASQEVKNAGAHGIQYRMDFNNPNLSEAYKMINDQLGQARELQDSQFKVTTVNDRDTLCTKCYYPYLWVTIGSDGKFYPCGHRALANTEPLGNLLDPNKGFMDVLREQVNKARFPDGKCEYCPPVGLHASNLMQVLEKESQQRGFVQALTFLHKKYASD